MVNVNKMSLKSILVKKVRLSEMSSSLMKLLAVWSCLLCA